MAGASDAKSGKTGPSDDGARAPKVARETTTDEATAAQKSGGADLAAIRAEIDRTDDEILRLLNHRSRFVAEVASLKEKMQVPFYVPSRERQIVERLTAANAGPFPSEAIRSVFQEIFSACLSLEKTVRVA